MQIILYYLLFIFRAIVRVNGAGRESSGGRVGERDRNNEHCFIEISLVARGHYSRGTAFLIF